MNRKLAAIAIAVSAVAAAGSAAADDITIDPHTFVSSRDRAEVSTEVMGAMRAPVNHRAVSYYPQEAQDSGLTRAQVTAGYLAARDEVAAAHAEDGGASWRATAGARQVLPAPVLAGLDEQAQ